MREKIVHSDTGEKEIIYEKEHWEILQSLRKRAEEICSVFNNDNIETWVYGSIARGDVSEHSDIDIVLLRTIPSYRIEYLLDMGGYIIRKRRIVQATPNDIIKVHYELDDEVTITNIVSHFNNLNLEFYRYAGALSYSQLKENTRTPGIDKRLMLIEPTPQGHKESSILTQKKRVAHLLGISMDIIEQRIRVLQRRDKVGRTGIFINRELHPDEHVEEIIADLAKRNVFVRRRISI